MILIAPLNPKNARTSNVKLNVAEPLVHATCFTILKSKSLTLKTHAL